MTAERKLGFVFGSGCAVSVTVHTVLAGFGIPGAGAFLIAAIAGIAAAVVTFIAIDSAPS